MAIYYKLKYEKSWRLLHTDLPVMQLFDVEAQIRASLPIRPPEETPGRDALEFYDNATGVQWSRSKLVPRGSSLIVQRVRQAAPLITQADSSYSF